jgi:hypothetical protein
MTGGETVASEQVAKAITNGCFSSGVVLEWRRHVDRRVEVWHPKQSCLRQAPWDFVGDPPTNRLAGAHCDERK